MITVKFGGIYAQKIAPRYRKGIKLEAKTIVEVIEALNQSSIFADDLKEIIRTYPTSFLIGRSLKYARLISPEQAAGAWQLHGEGQSVTLHLVPRIQGAVEITTAMLIQAAVTAAISIGVSLVMSALTPTASSSGGAKRKSALYENGLQSQKEGIPLAYVAGRSVWCGFNVIEADIDITATGGGAGMIYTPPGGTMGSAAAYRPDFSVFDGSFKSLYEAIHGSGGGGGSKSRDNNLFSNATLRILGTPGAGPLRIKGDTLQDQQKNIFFNEIPWRDPGSNQLTKNGVGMAWRDGRPGQDAIPITPGIASNFNSSQALRKRNPQGSLLPGITNTTTSHDVNRVKARIGLTLLETGAKSGDQRDTSVTVMAEVKRASAANWQNAGSWQIKGKTTDQVQRQLNIYAPLAGSVQEPWMFRIVRVTEDSTSDRLENTTTFNGWSEIIDKELTYDGSNGGVPTALIAFQLDLGEFDANGPPEIATLIDGSEVEVPLGSDPDNNIYPDPWLGEWELKRTLEPVWHLRHMAINEGIGLGYDADCLNKFELLDIAKFNGQQVNGRRRYTLNEQFADEEDGWDCLVSVAQSFSAMLYDNGNGLVLVQDRPTGIVNTYLNNSDVEGRTFAYTFTPLHQRINEVTCEYRDPENFGKMATVTARDDQAIAICRALKLPNGGRIPRRVDKRGCANRQEAFDFARKLVWEAQNEVRTATWKCGLQAVRYLPGWIAEIDDERRTKSHRGRIKEIIDADRIRLDRPISRVPYAGYELRANMDGNFVKLTPTAATSSAASDVIHVPAHGLDADISIGISGAADKKPRAYRIVEIKDAGKGFFSVSARQHEENKFAILEGHMPAPPKEWPRMDFRLDAPVILPTAHTSVTDEITGPSHTLIIRWLPVAGMVRGYSVQVMGPEDGNFVQVYSGPDTQVRVPNAKAGTHHITVTAVNTLGASFDSSVVSYQLDYTGTSSLKAPVFLGFD